MTTRPKLNQKGEEDELTVLPHVHRRMYSLCFKGLWRWRPRSVLFIWLLLLAAAPPSAHGYFLGDIKAVLNGCKDHWTLQDRAAMPRLYQMTVCVNIRVVVPGHWFAFSYSSVHAPWPEFGLEGDEHAIYVQFLRVRHEFRLQLSLLHWHQVCLRRDVPGNTFSLEVDGRMVSKRTVIASAIPPYGSLWLGCRPREQAPKSNLGQVELYLFRMWSDLGNHWHCEDGTVIGWDSHYWGATSHKAIRRDPYLHCATTLGLGRLFLPSPDTPSLPASLTSSSNTSPANHVSTSTQTSPGTTLPAQITSGTSVSSASPLLGCDVSQLCSNTSAYYWMLISVEAKDGNKTQKDVHNLVSKAFGCHADGGDAAQAVTSFMDFCQGDRQLQVVEVSCGAKINISQTSCDVLLLLTHAVSAWDLQRAGVSALQQARERMRATIIGEVERVGRNLCEDVDPSSGGFVRCTSPLDDICQSNNSSTPTCSLLQLNSHRAPLTGTHSCSSESLKHKQPFLFMQLTVASAALTMSVCAAGGAPRLYDCTAFCNSTGQFYGLRINMDSDVVNITSIRSLLLNVTSLCNSSSQCRDYSEILQRLQGIHLECQETPQR
ncbi:uncharacterized protein LOC127531380 [Acanthochromis polyacanthus]|uniref:uncharacterized protein LOC127531380 n=1 Tax=Acanthochromis polyacanthus TaxID=80966 RepID=UPI00223424A6|nr:uncharacterized protein LOC127531380 [Acanthochromis polyacanthus]